MQPGSHRQTIRFPELTTAEGDIDGFAPIDSTGLKPGNATSSIQTAAVWTNGTDTGNATAYLVPNTGITIISDVDDVLRVTKIYQPKEGLLNSFARPYTPWMNMPDIYANWSSSYTGLHFHVREILLCARSKLNRIKTPIPLSNFYLILLTPDTPSRAFRL